MQRLIARLIKELAVPRNDDIIAELNKYRSMQQTEGWQVHVKYLLYLKGLLLADMLGREFTELEPIRKDVQHRAYVLVSEIIEFLIDPLRSAQSHINIMQHNLKQGATAKMGATKRS